MADETLRSFVEPLCDPDAGSDRDPETVLGQAVARQPEGIADRLRETADALDGPPDAARRAAKQLYAVLDATCSIDVFGWGRPSETDIGRKMESGLPEALLDACLALAPLLDGDGDAGIYARGALARADPSALPVPARIRSRDERSAALAFCAHNPRVEDDLVPDLAAVVCDRTAADTTRADAARVLDYGWAVHEGTYSVPLDKSTRESLVDALSDPEPMVRACVATALVKHLDDRIDGTPPTWAGAVVSELVRLIRSDHRDAKLRAVWTVAEYGDDEGVLAPRVISGALGVGTGAEVGLELVALDRSDLTRTPNGHRCRQHLRPALVSPAAVHHEWDRFFRHGWGESPESEKARELVATAVEDDPAAVPDADIDRFLDAIGPEPDAVDTRVAAALAGDRPGRVVDAVPVLSNATEAENDSVRLPAVAALAAVARHDPDAVPNARDELVDRVGPVVERDRHRSLRPDRLTTIADVDHDATVDALRTVSDCGDELEPGRVITAVRRLVDDHPASVADAAGSVAVLADAVGYGRRSRPAPHRARLLDALADLAGDRPAALAPAARETAANLFAPNADVRRAAARLVRRVGEQRPSDVPAWTRPLLPTASADADADMSGRDERVTDDAASPTETPLRVLVAERPGVVDRIADHIEAAATAEYNSTRRVNFGPLVSEAADADVEAARTVAHRFVAVALDPEIETPFGPRSVADIVEACPAAAPAAVDMTVEARADGLLSSPRYLDTLLETLAGAAPNRVREAIEREFGGPEAVVEIDDGDREARISAVEAAFDGDTHEPSGGSAAAKEPQSGGQRLRHKSMLHDAVLVLLNTIDAPDVDGPSDPEAVAAADLFEAIESAKPLPDSELAELTVGEESTIRVAARLGEEGWTSRSESEIARLLGAEHERVAEARRHPAERTVEWLLEALVGSAPDSLVEAAADALESSDGVESSDGAGGMSAREGPDDSADDH